MISESSEHEKPNAEILDEGWLIRYEGTDPRTGGPHKPVWVPKREISEDLIQRWRSAKTQVKPEPVVPKSSKVAVAGVHPERARLLANFTVSAEQDDEDDAVVAEMMEVDDDPGSGYMDVRKTGTNNIPLGKKRRYPVLSTAPSVTEPKAPAPVVIHESPLKRPRGEARGRDVSQPFAPSRREAPRPKNEDLPTAASAAAPPTPDTLEPGEVVEDEPAPFIPAVPALAIYTHPGVSTEDLSPEIINHTAPADWLLEDAHQDNWVGILVVIQGTTGEWLDGELEGKPAVVLSVFNTRNETSPSSAYVRFLATESVTGTPPEEKMSVPVRYLAPVWPWKVGQFALILRGEYAGQVAKLREDCEGGRWFISVKRDLFEIDVQDLVRFLPGLDEDGFLR